MGLDDGMPGGYVRRLLDLIEGRNPKTGRGPNVDGVVPERLKRLEIVLGVAGLPGKGMGHAVSLVKGDGRGGSGNVGSEGGKKDKGKKANPGVSPSPPPGSNQEFQSSSNGTDAGVDLMIQEMVNSISASASGSAGSSSSSSLTLKPLPNADFNSTSSSNGSSSHRPPSNSSTARTLLGADSVSYVEERVDDVAIRCECTLFEGAAGLARMW